MNLDTKVEAILTAITKSLAESDLSAQAKLEGARMAETWIAETSRFDLQFQTVAVEVPFFYFVDKFTVIVGKMDRIARDEKGLFGCEWKTAKGTTRWWNEEKWLEKIKMGAQIGVYALAMHEGHFIVPQGFDPSFNGTWKNITKITAPDLNGPLLWTPGVKSPRIMIRAITKEDPPNIWPSEGQAFIEFSPARLNATRNALAVRGAGIRAARGLGLPWQLPGLQCENRFSHTMCPFLEKYCGEYRAPDGNATIGITDPGRDAFAGVESLLRVPIDDPRVVILSASAYEDSTECLEKYRIEGNERGERFYQEELDKGQALHTALAAFYREATRE